jgi:aromatic ring-opening dioxygenase catalytic subunit (LigB family)
MAELIAAAGVPHSPHYPSQFPKDGLHHTSQHYRAVKDQLDAAKPDAIVVIANDHFNTFFLNNFPTFAIGVADTSFGPNDQTKMPHYDFAVHSELASHVCKVGINEGFDFAVTQEFGVDHAILVPLHYLTDGVEASVVPLWVNALVRPLPAARRCYALGRMLKAAIESLAGRRTGDRPLLP